MWKLKTNKGRIVYERPRKEFKWTDAHRIVKKIEVPTIWDGDFLRQYWHLVGTARAVAAKIAGAGVRAAIEGVIGAKTEIFNRDNNPRNLLPDYLTAVRDASVVIVQAGEELEEMFIP